MNNPGYTWRLNPSVNFEEWRAGKEPTVEPKGNVNNRYVTTSIRGFVQQIATCYLRHGYRWYVTRTIPDYKTPESIDQKLIGKYESNIGEWKRTWRKKNGLANMQYLRHEQFFMLLATNGKHQFFDEESDQIRDIPKQPLRYGGYSISYRPGGRTRNGDRDSRWYAHVQIDRKRYSEMKAWFEEMAYSLLMSQLRQGRAQEWALCKLSTIGESCRAM